MQSEVEKIENITEYLEQHQKKELLRFVTVGSVDDGKSTLIGRLLHDTKGVYEDQLASVKKASHQKDMEIDFSLFTDGLKAEREQGITIDVAYRYFSTENRKFIIADTPGHVQYTRNMATGASTANVGIILIDARLGVLQQSRRHAYIASLLGIPHLLVAVNKMDLKLDHGNLDKKVFDDILADFRDFSSKLDFKDVKFIPISAKDGDNVVHNSKRTPWYDGGTLLDYLESVPIAADRNDKDFRFPVQTVLRPDLNYRGFAGEVTGGVVKKGDEVIVLPSRKKSRVVSIDTYDGEREQAGPCSAVSIRLADEIDISRGDMLVHPNNVPQSSRRFNAHVVWMSENDLDMGKSYLLKHTTRTARVNIEEITSVTDLETLEEQKAEVLHLNDIGQLRLATHQPLHFDAYKKSRATGAFILIDSLTNNTVAAGMIIGPAASKGGLDDEHADAAHNAQVSPRERGEVTGQIGAVIHVSGNERDALAFALERALYDRQRPAMVIHPKDAVSLARGGVENDVAATAQRLATVGVMAIVATDLDTTALRHVLGPKRVLSARFADDAFAINGEHVKIKSSEPEAVAAALMDALERQGLFFER
jgi:sulfate adenylyltransferase large subunit